MLPSGYFVPLDYLFQTTLFYKARMTAVKQLAYFDPLMVLI